MKKLFALILTAVFLCSTAYAAEIDLSDLSFAELLELQQRVTMAMLETGELKEFIVPQGVYKIGEDLPAGKWSLKCLGDGGMISIFDDEADYNAYRVSSFFSVEEGEFCNLELKESTYIDLTFSSIALSKGYQFGIVP